MAMRFCIAPSDGAPNCPVNPPLQVRHAAPARLIIGALPWMNFVVITELHSRRAFA
jgi:hypothetical protein